MFVGLAQQNLMYLSRTKPLIFAVMNRTIFFKNNTILYVNRNIFDSFLKQYQENAYSVFATMT